MPATIRKASKPKQVNPAAKVVTTRKMSNAELIKLAAKRKPPQRWHDEQVDPFVPESKG